jgi:hypothetical protein
VGVVLGLEVKNMILRVEELTRVLEGITSSRARHRHFVVDIVSDCSMELVKGRRNDVLKGGMPVEWVPR